MKELRILIAGDVSDFATSISMSVSDFLLKNEIEFKIFHALKASDIFELLQEEKFDIILADEKLPMIEHLLRMFSSPENNKSFWSFFFNSAWDEEISQEVKENVFRMIKRRVIK